MSADWRSGRVFQAADRATLGHNDQLTEAAAVVCSGLAPGGGGCGATLEDMGGPRSRARRLALAAAVAAPAIYALWLRPRLLTWGATPEETTGAYPGDELIPDADHWTTMATTLPAPPERVWPWLVQMGLGRGGWYSWDWLDNHGTPSADRIVAHWQHLEVGQHLDRVPKGPTNWWTVAVLEPGRTLVLQGSYGSLTGQGFDSGCGPWPWAWVEGVWGFHPRPAPGGRTRLVARTRNRSRPRWLARPYGLLLGELLHFSMQTRQFHNLHARVGAKDEIGRDRGAGPERL
jgi:hypothetical protein